MQNILVGPVVKIFTFSILSVLKLNLSTTFWHNLIVYNYYLGQILVTVEKMLFLHIVAFMPGLSKLLVKIM